jgi:hypothetical protein
MKTTENCILYTKLQVKKGAFCPIRLGSSQQLRDQGRKGKNHLHNHVTPRGPGKKLTIFRSLALKAWA